MNKRVLLVVILLFSQGCNLAAPFSGSDNNNGGGSSSSSTSNDPLTAIIAEIAGTVQARQPGQSDFKEAQTGLTLQVQGLVKTADDGRARLDLSSGTIVRVAPATVFTLTDNQSASDKSLATKIKLEAGKLWVVLKGGVLDIDSPAGQAGVRGSYLSIAIDPVIRGVYVTCLEGTCTVQNPAGRLDLTDGDTGLLLPPDPATNTYVAPQLGRMTPLDFEDWQVNVPEASSIVPAISATAIASRPTPTAAPANVPCVITLSGAVSKTLSCTVQFFYSAADGTTGLRIVSDAQVTIVAAFPEAQFIFTMPGEIAPGTYTEGQQFAAVFSSIDEAWTRDSDSGIGSSSITFTSLDAGLTSAQGIQYLGHGTVTATLESQISGSGAIQMTITF